MNLCVKLKKRKERRDLEKKARKKTASDHDREIGSVVLDQRIKNESDRALATEKSVRDPATVGALGIENDRATGNQKN